MIFKLTDSLADEILFAMEDQQNNSAVDAAVGTVVSLESVEIDDENYYALPEWSSGDGYSVLQEFTNNLHSPLAREELKRVLTGGRGVFRRFKDVIKSYPEVEHKWHYFKNARMKKRLYEWYASLRESWGLEELEFSEEDYNEETCDLVHDDFVFNKYNPIKDVGYISSGYEVLKEEYTNQYPFEIGDAIAFMWKNLSSIADSNQKFGFVCYTQAEDFAGCLLFSSCPSSANKTVALTDFFVLKNYRGLGIAQELLDKSLAEIRSKGVQWVLIFNTVVPEEMEPLLFRFGFTKIGSGYLADLAKDNE